MFRDLYFTLNFVKEFITQNNLLELYQQVISSFQELQNNLNEETEKNFQESQKDLFDTLSLVNYSSWSPSKLSALKHVGGFELFGPQAIGRVIDIFQSSLGNPGTTVQKLGDMRTETNNLLSKVRQLIEILKLEGVEIASEEGRKTVEITFQGDATLGNFWEVKDRAKELEYITRTITRLTGVDFETAKITAISTGSDPVSIALDLFQRSADSLLAIAKAAIELKKLKDIFLEKKKKTEELGLSKETVKIVLKDLDDQRDSEHHRKIGELSLSITKEFKEKKSEANDEHEIENMVSIALEKMTNLVNDGVKILDPEEITPVGTSEAAILGNSYSEVKKIEERIEPLLLEENKERQEKRKKKMRADLEIENLNKELRPSSSKKINKRKNRAATKPKEVVNNN